MRWILNLLLDEERNPLCVSHCNTHDQQQANLVPFAFSISVRQPTVGAAKVSTGTLWKLEGLSVTPCAWMQLMYVRVEASFAIAADANVESLCRNGD